MFRVMVICAFAGLLMSLGAVATQNAAGQRFPYEAPQAPEFDDRGNPVDTAAEKEPSRNFQPSRVRAPRAPRAASAPPPPLDVTGPRRSPDSVPPPNVPEQEPQGPPDCTQFPGLIASAQAPNQLQWYARQYLTCLLKRGWGMPQARQEVIRIIEASQRGAR